MHVRNLCSYYVTESIKCLIAQISFPGSRCFQKFLQPKDLIVFYYIGGNFFYISNFYAGRIEFYAGWILTLLDLSNY